MRVRVERVVGRRQSTAALPRTAPLCSRRRARGWFRCREALAAGTPNASDPSGETFDGGGLGSIGFDTLGIDSNDNHEICVKRESPCFEARRGQLVVG